MKMESGRVNGGNGQRFTLIELMVVIGIIMILASMLLPMMMKSKETARAIFCKNNLKNLSTANIVYSNEWDRFAAWGSDYKTTNLIRWHGKRDSVSNAVLYNQSMGPLHGYFEANSSSGCPEFSKFANQDADSEERGGGGYGYNLYIGSSAYFTDDPDSDESYCAGIRVRELHDPTNTLMFADTAMSVDSSGNIAGNAGGGLAEFSVAYAPFGVSECKTDRNLLNDPSIHFRHSRTANIAWADAHASSKHMEWTLDSGWRNKRLGFFGSREDNSIFDPF